MKKHPNSKTEKAQTIHILMIEDMEDDALLVLRELKRGGFAPVFQKVNSAEATEKALRNQPWDVVLCDYKMPAFNAPAAIALIKKINRELPIIIVSGNIGEETAIECMRLGAQDYIMKSNLSRLCPAVARELEEAKTRKGKKLAEELLSQSEEKHRVILENIEDGYYEVDLAGHFTFFNDAVCRILGYPRDELLGMSFKDYSNAENADILFHVFHEIYQTGSPAKEIHWQIISKDGEKKYIEASASLIQPLSGRPIGFRGIIRDITERKLMEEKLRNSELMFRSLFENSAVGVFLLKDRAFTKVNRALCNVTGYTPEELVGQPVQIGYASNEEYVRAGISLYEQVAQKGVGITEALLKRKDGEIFDALLYLTPVDPQNSSLGFEAIMIDITDRKRAEEALRRSEAKYRNIFENALEGIYQVTMEGKFIAANNALARMSGYDSPEDFMESIRDITTQLYVHPEDREQFLKVLTAHGFVENFEVEFFKKDRSVFWVVLNARMVRDEQGNILYNEGLVEDISLRKQTEEELKRSLEKLKRAMYTTIQVLVSALEARDPYTAGHQHRSADLACAIVSEMGLAEEKMHGIRMAAAIHDIGKLSIPAEILSKPSKLTDLEFSLIKEHAQSGFEMLKDVDSAWPLAEIVHQHHERINGTGYPRQLKGDEILLEARIMAVADVVEAMASHRPYRPSLGIDAAIDEIEKNRGILYDADVVDACLRLFREKGYSLE